MSKMQVKNVSVKIPAGEYWLGDPCYSFNSQDEWMELLHSCDYYNNPIGTVVVGGKTFQVLGFGTKYGDGVYKDQEGNEYGVDAGLIGLVPVELNPDADLDLVHKVVFTTAVECSAVDGVLEFGKYTINTDYDDEPVWEDEDQDDDS